MYRGYYRIHGETEWILLGDLFGGWAAFDVPEAMEHSFDLKVTSRGDGVTFSSVELDSNVVQTVNDAELPPAPAITDLSASDVQSTAVTVTWESVLLESVDYEGFFREAGSQEWALYVSGTAGDGAALFDGLDPGLEYEFKIQTFGQWNQMQYSIVNRADSNVVTATPGAGSSVESPTDLDVDTYMGDGGAYALFWWTPPASGADSYTLAVALQDGYEGAFQNETGFALHETGIPGPESDAFALDEGTDYVAAVKTVKNGVESEWSTFVFFTTPAQLM